MFFLEYYLKTNLVTEQKEENIKQFSLEYYYKNKLLGTLYFENYKGDDSKFFVFFDIMFDEKIYRLNISINSSLTDEFLDMNKLIQNALKNINYKESYSYVCKKIEKILSLIESFFHQKNKLSLFIKENNLFVLNKKDKLFNLYLLDMNNNSLDLLSFNKKESKEYFLGVIFDKDNYCFNYPFNDFTKIIYNKMIEEKNIPKWFFDYQENEYLKLL